LLLCLRHGKGKGNGKAKKLNLNQYYLSNAFQQLLALLLPKDLQKKEATQNVNYIVEK